MRWLAVVGLLSCLLMMVGLPAPSASAPARVMILYGQDTFGEIEPCGCPTSPLGGYSHRGALLRRLRGEGHPTLLLEGGNTLYRGEPSGGRDPEVDKRRARLILDLLELQGTAAMAVGPRDLWVAGAQGLKALAAGRKLSLLSINLRAGQAAPFPPSVVVQVGGHSVGVIGITSPELELPPGEDLRALDPDDLVAAEARRLAPLTDLVIALSNQAEPLNERLSAAAPDLDFALAGPRDREVRGGAGVYDADSLPPFLTGVAGMGRHLGRIDLFYSASPGARPLPSVELAQSLRKEAIAQQQLANLAHRIEEEEGRPRPDRVAREGALLQRQVEAARAGLASPSTRHLFAYQGVPIFPSEGVDPPSQALIDEFKAWSTQYIARREKERAPLVSFAGTQTCRGCHPLQTANWMGTDHARAWESLTRVGRDKDPECIGCHTTGFNQSGGFFRIEDGPAHAQVGCESCHGPLSDHPTRRKIPQPTTRATCETCHDKVNSPAFDYLRYRKAIVCPSGVITPGGTVGEVER